MEETITLKDSEGNKRTFEIEEHNAFSRIVLLQKDEYDIYEDGKYVGSANSEKEVKQIINKALGK